MPDAPLLTPACLRKLSVILFLASAWLAARAGTPVPELVEVLRDGQPRLIRPEDHRGRDLALSGACLILALAAGTSWSSTRQ